MVFAALKKKKQYAYYLNFGAEIWIIDKQGMLFQEWKRGVIWQKCSLCFLIFNTKRMFQKFIKTPIKSVKSMNKTSFKIAYNYHIFDDNKSKLQQIISQNCKRQKWDKLLKFHLFTFDLSLRPRITDSLQITILPFNFSELNCSRHS